MVTLVDSSEIALAALPLVQGGDDPSDSLSHATRAWTQRCGLPTEDRGHINIKIYEGRPQLLPSKSKQQSHLPVAADLTGMICGCPGRDPEHIFFLQSTDEKSSASWSLIADGLGRCERVIPHKKTQKPCLIPLELFAFAALDQPRDVNGVRTS